jgi:hypothetical protein
LAAAFEVLDLARVLFGKKLEQPEEGEGKGKAIGDSSMTKHIKEVSKVSQVVEHCHGQESHE